MRPKTVVPPLQETPRTAAAWISIVNKRDETTMMGGGGRRFPTTSWTLVLGAQEQKKIKEALYDLYWRPLYCLLRHRGFSNDEAKEHTQDFLTQILLGREFLSKVERRKGKKFRSFLVKAFLNHVHGRLRKDREHRLDDGGMALQEASAPDVDSATRTFDYEWAVTILQWVLEDVKVQCQHEGLEVHWQVFTDRIVAPTLDDAHPPPLSALCQRYGVSSEGQVSNMIVTVKRRFHKTLMRCLSNCAESPQGCREVLNDFMSIFSNE